MPKLVPCSSLVLISHDNIFSKARTNNYKIMTTVSIISRQNNPGLRALTVALGQNFVVVVLVLGSKFNFAFCFFFFTSFINLTGSFSDRCRSKNTESLSNDNTI